MQFFESRPFQIEVLGGPGNVGNQYIAGWRQGVAEPEQFGKLREAGVVEPAGVPDTTVSFIALREPGGRLISVYSAYGLHYVGGVGNAHISAGHG